MSNHQRTQQESRETEGSLRSKNTRSRSTESRSPKEGRNIRKGLELAEKSKKGLQNRQPTRGAQREKPFQISIRQDIRHGLVPANL